MEECLYVSLFNAGDYYNVIFPWTIAVGSKYDGHFKGEPNFIVCWAQCSQFNLKGFKWCKGYRLIPI